MIFKEETKPQKQIEERIYSDAELEAFDKEMDQYKFEKEIEYPIKQIVTLYNYESFYEKMGATRNGSIVLTHQIRNEYGTLESCRNLYRELQNKIDQWLDYKSRKSFGERKRLEGLEELAQGMKIE